MTLDEAIVHAEKRVKELETEVSNLYKRLAESADTEQPERGE